MVGLIDVSHAIALLRAIELGSDWFVLMLAVAVLSKHSSYFFLLGAAIRRPMTTCDFARASAVVLLTARATMCLFAIGNAHDDALAVDIGRIIANFMTAVAVVPLFLSLKKTDDCLIEPERIGKLFRLIIVLFLSTVAIGAAVYMRFIT